MLVGAHWTDLFGGVERVSIRACILLTLSRDSDPQVRDTASWMQTSGVVAALLRTHLHQAQFVAVLKRIMQLMTDLGLLSEAHLEALWASADRDFAFQAVRDNTLELVGALAPRLTQPLLHFLLDKVHRSVSREEADVAPTLDLLGETETALAWDGVADAATAAPMARTCWPPRAPRSATGVFGQERRHGRGGPAPPLVCRLHPTTPQASSAPPAPASPSQPHYPRPALASPGPARRSLPQPTPRHTRAPSTAG